MFRIYTRVFTSTLSADSSEDKKICEHNGIELSGAKQLKICSTLGVLLYIGQVYMLLSIGAGKNWGKSTTVIQAGQE